MANDRRVLSDPQIKINNENIKIVPNSATYMPGRGETITNTVSAGNGNIDVVTGKNVETQKSKLTFSLKNTEANQDLVDKYKQLTGLLTVSISEGTFNKIIRVASIANDPEYGFSNDSNVSVEIEGLPAK